MKLTLIHLLRALCLLAYATAIAKLAGLLHWKPLAGQQALASKQG